MDLTSVYRKELTGSYNREEGEYPLESSTPRNYPDFPNYSQDGDVPGLEALGFISNYEQCEGDYDPQKVIDDYVEKYPMFETLYNQLVVDNSVQIPITQEMFQEFLESQKFNPDGTITLSTSDRNKKRILTREAFLRISSTFFLALILSNCAFRGEVKEGQEFPTQSTPMVLLSDGYNNPSGPIEAPISTFTPEPTQTEEPTPKSTLVPTPTTEPTPDLISKVESSFLSSTIDLREPIEGGIELKEDSVMLRIPIASLEDTPPADQNIPEDTLLSRIPVEDITNFDITRGLEIGKLLSGSVVCFTESVKMLDIEGGTTNWGVSKSQDGLYLDLILINGGFPVSDTEIIPENEDKRYQFLKNIEIPTFNTRLLVEDVVNPGVGMFLRESRDPETLLQVIDFRNYWNTSGGDIEKFKGYYKDSQLEELVNNALENYPSDHILTGVDHVVLLNKIFDKLNIPDVADEYELNAFDVLAINNWDPENWDLTMLVTNVFKRDILFKFNTKNNDVFLYGLGGYSVLKNGAVVFPSNEEFVRNPESKYRIRVVLATVINERGGYEFLISEVDDSGKVIIYRNDQYSEEWMNLVYLRLAAIVEK
jgi:hypothetical protein